MITLYLPDGSHLDITADDNSFRQRTIMGDDTLELSFSLTEYLEIPVGTYCMFQEQKYTLERPENFRKLGERNYEYSLVLDSPHGRFNYYMMHSVVPGDVRLKFTMTGKPRDFMEMLIRNLNERDGDGTWSFDKDKLVESNEKTVSFSYNTCMEALKMIAEAFETEWEIRDSMVFLRKVEHNKDAETAVRLSYGKGNGFLPGIGKAEYSAGSAVGVLYVQGGERNIDPNKYRKVIITDESDPDYPGVPGSRELRLPNNAAVWYDGEKFFDSEPVDNDIRKAVKYVTDAEGLYVRRAGELLSINEGYLDLTNIYPMDERIVGTVISKPKPSGDDPGRLVYDFIDSGETPIPDYNKYEIPGNEKTIIFQEGMLGGKEFKVNYIHAEKRFEIISETFDNIEMPNEQFRPYNKQPYVVFNVYLPNEYIAKAEKELLHAAVKYLWENEKPRFTFTGTLDGIWAKRNWTTGEKVGPKLMLGGYVLFSDTQFLPEGELIRITGIKDYVNNPHSPELDLSNETKQGSSYYNTIRKVDSNEVTADTNNKRLTEYTRRGFRDAMQTSEMLQNALLDFSEGINPVTVHTMQTIVGDESLQFRFLDAGGTVRELEIKITASHLELPEMRLQHMTIDREHEMTPVPKYREWTIKRSEEIDVNRYGAEASFYLYAIVPKEKTEEEVQYGKYDIREYIPESKEIIGGETAAGTGALPFDDGTNYNLLIGIINSSDGGAERSIVRLYGFTEILPGRITTDLLVSSDGKCNINLAENSFHFGDGSPDGNSLDWHVEETTNAYNEIERTGKLKVSGEVEATSGKIGGFNIEGGTLESVATKTDTKEPLILLNGNNGGGQFAAGKIMWEPEGTLNVGIFHVLDDRLVIEGTSPNGDIVFSNKTVNDLVSNGGTRYMSTNGTLSMTKGDPDISEGKYIFSSNTVSFPGNKASGYRLSGSLNIRGKASCSFLGAWAARTGARITGDVWIEILRDGYYVLQEFAGKIDTKADYYNPEMYFTFNHTFNNAYAHFNQSATVRIVIWNFEAMVVGNFPGVTSTSLEMNGSASVTAVSTTRETLIGSDGILIRQDDSNEFKIQQNNGKIAISIKGLPASATSVNTGELYRSGNQLMIK